METRVLGAYRLLEELGSGGMAKVYLAEVLEDRPGLEIGDRVAVKVLHRHLVSKRTFNERFRREADAGSRIRHENVVRTLDIGFMGDGEEGHNYIVTEYIEGITLRDLLDEVGRVPEDHCLSFALDVARALRAIHAEGVVHRDLKPENILLTDENVAKVTDLGVAYLVDDAIRLSATGQFVGSIYYAAPEQLKGGGKDLDARVDLYQLGVLMYELVGGIHPYRRDSVRESIRLLLSVEPPPLSESCPGVSPFFEELVGRLMARDRDDRFPGAEELEQALVEGQASGLWQTGTVPIRESAQTRRTPQTSHHGRGAEIALLHSVWMQAGAGRGMALLVTGSPGIGKTRLIEEFQRRLTEEGEDHAFLTGAYLSGRKPVARGAFSTAFREYVGDSRLEKELGLLLESTPLLVPSIAAFIRGVEPPEGAPRLDLDGVGAAFVTIMSSLASRRPTVIVIEDLHLAHEEGLALFARLAGTVADHRTLLIGTARPGLPAEWVRKVMGAKSAREVRLARLDDDALRELLAESLGSDRLADALFDRIAVKSGGKPLYALEILRALRERQLIGPESKGTRVTTREISELNVPETIREAVLERISNLDEEDRRLLEAACCCGFEFDPTIVARSVGEGRIAVLRRLASLERATQLVHPVGKRHAFDDHAVQETLYADLEPGPRRQHHAALGAALESGATPGADIGGENEVELCEHFLKGGRPDRARRYLGLAFDHLALACRNARAVELMNLALAAEGLLDGAPRARALFRSARLLDLLGWTEEEHDALTEAMEIVEEANDLGLRARARRLLGDFHRRQSDHPRARELLAVALELAALAGAAAEEAGAAGSLGLIAWSEGRLPEAKEYHERALSLTEGTGDLRRVAIHRRDLGQALCGLGRHEEARGQLETALGLARECRDLRIEAETLARYAQVLAAGGRHASAVKHLRDAVTISRNLGDVRGVARGRLCLGLLQPGLGRLEAGTALLEEVLSVFKGTGGRAEESAALLGLGTIAQAEGRVEEAGDLYTESMAIREEIGSRLGVAESALARGRLQCRTGRGGMAMEDLVRVLKLGQEMDCPRSVVLAAAYLASMARGDLGFATSYLERNRGRLDLRTRMEAHFVLHGAGHDHGDLVTARSLLEDIIDNAPPDCREGMRITVPLHREILEGAVT